MNSFESFKLSGEILKSLKLLGYEKPTNVQRNVIGDILKNKDLIVKSQTGSGKTASFAIPVCEKIVWDENKPQALVITPTRELALQVKDEIFNIGRFKRLKVSAVFGKAPFGVQARELKQKMHVVVGTPGRIIDHLSQGTLDVSQIKYLIIDEADELLNMGFIEQLEDIIKRLPKRRVNLLFSATYPDDIKILADQYMNNPDLFIVKSDLSPLERITQIKHDVLNGDKLTALKQVITVENPDTCMVFCNTRLMVDEVYEYLKRRRVSCGKIHGGMNQRDRLREMDRFKKGQFRYLIATGVAARGIDVEAVSLVINFDFPEQPEDYVHRIGRTGRKDLAGRAIAFVSEKDDFFLEDVEDYLNKSIQDMPLPDRRTVMMAKADFEEKMSAKLTHKKGKASKLNENILKIHINAGKKQKMRAADIVGTLCSIDGMTKDDIGVITIMDLATYFEILNGKGPMVLKALKQKTIKGRIRKVNKADRELFPGERRSRRKQQ